MKKLPALLVVILLFLPVLVSAESEISCIINLIDNPEAEFEFKEGAEILEVVFPRIYSSDCAFLRFGDQTMLVDASINNEEMQRRIRMALKTLDIDHFDIAYNSHPHNDHIQGFAVIGEYAPIKKFLITFPDDYNIDMRNAVRYMKERSIPVERIGDQSVITLGANDEVIIHVIQYDKIKSWPDNDKSSMLHVSYKNRSMLLTGDNEGRSQKYFAENPPHISLKVDILKYPHHGQTSLLKGFRELIRPELMYINGASNIMRANKKDYQKLEIPYLIGYKGVTRMRTDGEIWVIDYIEEAQEQE